MVSEHIHFVTGRLAENSLRQVLEPLAPDVGVSYSIDVLPITVAALMTPEWIAKQMALPLNPKPSRVLIPGYCGGDLTQIEEKIGAPVERGPLDLRKLPSYFNSPAVRDPDYGKYSIEIIAEINHCPRLSREEILSIARQYSRDGADVIDLGCDPGTRWTKLSETVKMLREEGMRVSIDSMNMLEIADASRAGAELVLSVNASNRDAAPDWGIEVVVIPDDPSDLRSLEDTVAFLSVKNVPFRIDPILEPIGFGFTKSLRRYMDVRSRYPDTEMMMGIGNLTELTEVDSAGVNTVLLAICEELGIRSVLTTEVIPWAKSSVKECELARQLVHYAVQKKTLPKHVNSGLVMLRDTEVVSPTPSELDALADEIKDPNYRTFATESLLHLVGKKLHVQGDDPFDVFSALMKNGNPEVISKLSPSHAFYLGFELCKAATAQTLGKQYTQDEPLDWGFLTKAENSHRETRIQGASKGTDNSE